MTRVETIARPDRFALEAAARRHRADGIGALVTTALSWPGRLLRAALPQQQTLPLALVAARRSAPR